jgi:hypothetical protein
MMRKEIPKKQKKMKQSIPRAKKAQAMVIIGHNSRRDFGLELCQRRLLIQTEKNVVDLKAIESTYSSECNIPAQATNLQSDRT